MRYELDFDTTEDGILHSHRRENLKSYRLETALSLKVGIFIFTPVLQRVKENLFTDFINISGMSSEKGTLNTISFCLLFYS
jgi:hypothetical protein